MYLIKWDGNEEHISQHSGEQLCPSSETPQAADSLATPCLPVRVPAADTHSMGGLWLPDMRLGIPEKVTTTSVSLNFFICAVGKTPSAEHSVRCLQGAHKMFSE